MKNIYAPIFCLLVMNSGMAQTIVWQNDFETPAEWILNTSSGSNGVDANLWVISDAEGGVAAGSCGVASNGNKTLHISCQGAWCVGTGATYNAGDGGLGFIDAATHKRTYLANNISTLNTQNLSLEFDYIGIGQQGFDYGTILYSINGGSTWNTLQVINPATTCASGQGLWTHLSIPLPANCTNIANFRIGFEWVNDNDGAGSDPSLALNNLKITTPAQPSVAAQFDLSGNGICPGDCISFINNSTGASTYAWDFGNGMVSTNQNPPQVCYPAPGNYPIQLIACNANTCDTMLTMLTVNPLLYGQTTVTANGSYLWPANGNTYNVSGTYVDTISNANACDSVVTLNLTILTGGIDDLEWITSKRLVRITDVSGRITVKKPGQLLILYYEDGTMDRIWVEE